MTYHGQTSNHWVTDLLKFHCSEMEINNTGLQIADKALVFNDAQCGNVGIFHFMKLSEIWETLGGQLWSAIQYLPVSFEPLASDPSCKAERFWMQLLCATLLCWVSPLALDTFLSQHAFGLCVVLWLCLHPWNLEEPGRKTSKKCSSILFFLCFKSTFMKQI